MCPVIPFFFIPAGRFRHGKTDGIRGATSRTVVAHSLANRPVIRYADVFLMYAECAANGAGDKGLVFECADHWYDLLRWKDFVSEPSPGIIKLCKRIDKIVLLILGSSIYFRISHIHKLKWFTKAKVTNSWLLGCLV